MPCHSSVRGNRRHKSEREPEPQTISNSITTMKKTIIALMALTGVAAATDTEMSASEFSTYWENALNSANYEYGDTFSLTLTILDSTNYNNHGVGGVLQLGENLYLMTQLGNYLGLNSVANSNDSIERLAGSAITTVGYENSFTVTSTQKIWLSYSGTNDNSGFRNTMPSGVNNVAITLSTDGVNSSIYLDFDGSTEYDSNITISDYVLDATKIRLCSTTADADQHIGGGLNFKAANVSYSIPEPTTATLSLLALAGLAARRRRR